MKTEYIDCKTFDDFKRNQDILIQALNHNTTKMSVDIGWLKKLTIIQLGLIFTLTGATIIKFILG